MRFRDDERAPSGLRVTNRALCAKCPSADGGITNELRSCSRTRWRVFPAASSMSVDGHAARRAGNSVHIGTRASDLNDGNTAGTLQEPATAGHLAEAPIGLEGMSPSLKLVVISKAISCPTRMFLLGTIGPAGLHGDRSRRES